MLFNPSRIAQLELFFNSPLSSSALDLLKSVPSNQRKNGPSLAEYFVGTKSHIAKYFGGGSSNELMPLNHHLRRHIAEYCSFCHLPADMCESESDSAHSSSASKKCSPCFVEKNALFGTFLSSKCCSIDAHFSALELKSRVLEHATLLKQKLHGADGIGSLIRSAWFPELENITSLWCQPKVLGMTTLSPQVRIVNLSPLEASGQPAPTTSWTSASSRAVKKDTGRFASFWVRKSLCCYNSLN